MKHCKSKANVLKIRSFSECISKVYDTCKNVGQWQFYDTQLKVMGVLYETDEPNIDAKTNNAYQHEYGNQTMNMKYGRYQRLFYGG